MMPARKYFTDEETQEGKRQKSKSWRMRNPRVHRITSMLSAARQRAKLKGLEFSIETDDINIPDVCPILGIKLDITAKKPSDNLPSLDRIDPAKGYVKGNVWVISWKANELKTNNTLETLRQLVTALERLY